MHLLLVEDDPTIAGPLNEGLRREGFAVTHAPTGAAALVAGPPEIRELATAMESMAVRLDALIDEQSTRLATLVADLLRLARADRQAPGTDVELRALLVERTDMWSAVADERALRRFWRGDPSIRGTGLGLAIASALVSSSGGAIELEDGPGHGLRVVVSLPASSDRTGQPS